MLVMDTRPALPARICMQHGALEYPSLPLSQVVSDYVSDPLNTVGNVAMRTGAECLNAFRALAPKYAAFTLPVLAVHGTVDK